VLAEHKATKTGTERYRKALADIGTSALLIRGSDLYQVGGTHSKRGNISHPKGLQRQPRTGQGRCVPWLAVR
jgi:hypothetical protein